MAADDSVLNPVFKNHSVYNEAKSRVAGRPIYDDMEIVEIRFPGDRNRISAFPAHAESGLVDTEDGRTEKLTYAQRFADQYKRFKKDDQQVRSGTPIEALPFLTPAKRSEFKALNIYTAEQLASLEGEQLKSLGPDGRSLKTQSQAYIETAAGTADVASLQDENERLKAQLAALGEKTDTAPKATVKPKTAQKAAEKPKDEPASEPSKYEDWEDADLKAFIEEKSGSKPRGNPSHATLVGMADELGAKG